MDQPNPEPPASPPAAPATPVPAPGAAEETGKAQITIDDFLKLDLRVATVRECKPHPNADKLLVLQLDDGSEGGRQICAGLRGIYEPEQLVGRQIVVVANLAARKMRGEISQGMLLAASNADRSEVVIVSPTAPIEAGASVG